MRSPVDHDRNDTRARLSPSVISSVVGRRNSGVCSSSVLGLLHLHPHGLVGVFVMPAHLELGMPGLVNPLVEEPLQVLARRRFHRLAEIVGLDDCELVRGHVTPNPLPPGRIAHQPSQHVQHARSLWNRSRRRTCRRMIGIAPRRSRDERTGLLPWYPAGRPVHIEPEDVVAVILLGEKCGEIGGEPFVEPDVRPVLAGQVVAEPLVGQLVRDQAVGVALESGDLVDERACRSSSWR